MGAVRNLTTLGYHEGIYQSGVKRSALGESSRCGELPGGPVVGTEES